MLKALELLGFKSFADRTRFEFPHGITVIVGPNGSGKSNIVDSIKWVLGEQSVKSLRGKEMADVIFNGSGSRRGLNSAEITLTFDNASHLFCIDAAEVHITRRIYRSGEGEYLINRQPCRLRDIRDLLAGTGLGTQAYSVIEQGKVDVLLQSSPRDRRIIFEEAAGISRFKAKKIEALRRLERVQQNLLRLSDIVEEVENRLRSVRNQAGKARRYREYTGRLQELRTQVALVDWRRLSEQLSGVEGRLRSMTDERDAAVAQAESMEARLLELETQLGDLTEGIRQSEAQIAGNRERIAAQEAAIEHERARSRDLEQEVARHRRQLVAASARDGALQQQMQETVRALREAEERHQQIARLVTEGERELSTVMTGLDQLRSENEQRRGAYVEQMRATATLGNEISGLESQATALVTARQWGEQRLTELDRQRDALAAELEELRRQRGELSGQVDRQEEELTEAGARLAELQQQLTARQNELADLRQRHTGAAERAAVLEELQRRHEGLGAGVKEVIEQAQKAPDGPLQGVCGLVADLLSASVEVAPLIDAALGQTAQFVVAERSQQLVEHLRDESPRFAGRVGFVWLDPQPAETKESAVDLTGQPGVLGRADKFVETSPRFAPLAQRLLGQTWIVEKLAHAFQLAKGDWLRAPAGQAGQEDVAARCLSPSGDAANRPNYVTLAGELLAADGTLVVGPRQAAVGLVSRRSQLRALHVQMEELAANTTQVQSTASRLQQQIAAQQEHIQALNAEHRRSGNALAEFRFKITAAEERRAHLDQQRAVVESEIRAAVVQHETTTKRIDDARGRRQQLDAKLAQLEADLARLKQEIDQAEQRRQVHGQETTETKVELAKREERLRNLQTQVRQCEENRQDGRRAMAESREQTAQCTRRMDAARWNILRAESEIAELYLCKEAFARQTVAQIGQRDLSQRQRAELSAQAQAIRGRIHQVEEHLHALDLEASQVQHERSTLAARLREDYGIELAEVEHPAGAEDQHERESVQQEIEDLRRKITNLGNVNLEALEELDQLEQRFKTLSEQYQDLSGAKAALERIIDKINTDSRRLFTETLQTVRGHFQTLFRDLFGGGHADIVMEEGVDILESGIEIVARPPGKEPRSISLLSGGEKTMTCVALLLAIFRSRPSPFCVLDEVDAALDEANIDRFTKVLQDFLAWTQFLIITHSKRTMTCASTLYGVTMQESGISKQVSVRFEDVSDDGHILPERLAAEEQKTEAA